MGGKGISAEQKVIPYKLNGIDGVWMPLDIANKAASDAEMVPLLQKKIAELELLASIRNERFLNTKDGLELAEVDRHIAIESASLEEARRIAAEEKLKSWYRHPLLWFSLGLVIAVSAETALIISTK
jgi:hypothetical protein